MKASQHSWNGAKTLLPNANVDALTVLLWSQSEIRYSLQFRVKVLFFSLFGFNNLQSNRKSNLICPWIFSTWWKFWRQKWSRNFKKYEKTQIYAWSTEDHHWRRFELLGQKHEFRIHIACHESTCVVQNPDINRKGWSIVDGLCRTWPSRMKTGWNS